MYISPTGGIKSRSNEHGSRYLFSRALFILESPAKYANVRGILDRGVFHSCVVHINYSFYRRE